MRTISRQLQRAVAPVGDRPITYPQGKPMFHGRMATASRIRTPDGIDRYAYAWTRFLVVGWSFLLSLTTAGFGIFAMLLLERRQ